MNIKLKLSVKLITKIKKVFPYLFWTAITILLVFKYYLITNFGDTDFLHTYKFFSFDSYDWLANGIRLFENDQISFRNPGLPLIIFCLHKFGVLYLLPLLNQFVFLGIIYLTYLLVNTMTKSRGWGYIFASMLFLNYSFQNFANYILADYYAILLILLATYLWVRSYKKLAFLALGISALFQNFSYFIFPVFIGLDLLLKDEEFLGFNKLFELKTLRDLFFRGFKNLILFLNVNIYIYLVKLVQFGNPLFSRIIQFELLLPNLNSLFFYIVNAYSLFGIGLLFVLYNLIKCLRSNLKNHYLIFLYLNLFVVLIFWVIVYEWNDRRFLLYCIPFLYALAAYYFAKLKSKFTLALLLLLFIYPTTISVHDFFNFNMLPLTNWNSITFKVSIDEKAQGSISLPATYVSREYPIVGILNPAYAELINNFEANRLSQATIYTYYKGIIDDANARNSKELCFNEGDSKGILNSILLIENNDVLDGDYNLITCEAD